jgi:plasmid stabilization system protein ParE
MAFRLAPQAESDLDDIWYFIATESDSVETADRFIDTITALRASRRSSVYRAPARS